MFGKMIVCNIDRKGLVNYMQRGEFIQVGVAVTPENSKLIEHVEYEAYAPDGLQALINHALLHKCVPNETTEFNVHYLG